MGLLGCLNRRFVLTLPDNVGGTVEAAGRPRSVPVEYGQTLFHLVRPGDETGGAGRTRTTAQEGSGDRKLSPGSRAIRSPTDGVFYCRPSPDAAPFVQTGQRVRRGQPLGLVEVMKTFNQIVYGGVGLPDEAEVVEICCSDAEEVGAGQVLIIVR